VSQLVILGCGYLGSHLARAALAAGRPVRACARGVAKLQPLADAGAEVKYTDVTIPKQLTLALASNHGGTVIYAVPPTSALPPGLAVRAAMQAAYGGGAERFIYFSSSGLFGAEPDDDSWIDETTAIAVDDPPMRNIATDEDEIRKTSYDKLRPVILRIAPVYGAGKGIRARLRKGDYRLLDDGQHAISRIYIDDLVRVVFAAEERAPSKSTYLVADDEPTTQREYAAWLTERMGIGMPPNRAMFEPGKPRVAHRNRKIKNALMKTELGVTLQYPTFREGEAAIEAAEAQP
jgi:nucleoside-diphosphate-sugar epimerase